MTARILTALSTPSLAPIATAELAAELASLVTEARPIAHVLQALGELDLAARLGRWSRARIEAKLPRYIAGVRPKGETRTGQSGSRARERAPVAYVDFTREPSPPPLEERTRDVAASGATLLATLGWSKRKSNPPVAARLATTPLSMPPCPSE